MVYLTGAFKTLPPTGCISPATNVEKVVCLAEDFKATLTSAQITTLQPALRIRLPQRIAITDLNMSQVLAALAVIKAASGTAINEGYDEFQEIRPAAGNH